MTGDELAQELAARRLCNVVSRNERDVYAFALRRVEERAREQGHEFRLVDADQALVEIGIRKTPQFVHRVKKYVRVIRPSILAVSKTIELGPVEDAVTP